MLARAQSRSLTVVAACVLSLALPSTSLATWSIVAVDPVTHEVGVAVASCIDLDVSEVVSAVAGHGAAATQGLLSATNRSRVTRALRDGNDARQVVSVVSGRAHEDEAHSERQYGAATLDATTAAAYSGDELWTWAGDQVGSTYSVQGNILRGKLVVTQALRAFVKLTDAPLADRLMAALGAGSAAGGDKRCNVQGIKQTSSSAAVVVLRPGDAPFDGARSTRGKGPFLHLHALDVEHRRNAVALLISQYERWRPHHLDGTVPTFGQVPTGDARADPVPFRPRPYRAWLAALSGFLLIGAAGMWFWSGRNQRSDQAARR